MKKIVNCVYGSEHTKGVLFVVDRWYCIEGSVNVNKTYDEIEQGVDVELLNDVDCYTSTEPINSLEELEKFLRDD